MAKSFHQKLKILYLMRLFLEETDESHALSMAELITILEGHGIKAERKSIYDDIEALRDFGMDILLKKSRPAGYYLAERTFELPELKLLVDSVQSSKFITSRKSSELIKKLESLTSHHEAVKLQRQVFVLDRVKTMNESIYYNVDKIHEAISRNKKIQFQYFEWTVSKEMKLRKNGAPYIISPWALTWQDDNYYMIGYDDEADLIKHYRVDKMLRIDITGDERLGKELFESFRLPEYTKKTFGMFGGEETLVTLRMKNSLIGVAIDRFGKDAAVLKSDEEYFLLRIRVALSPQFFGWLSGLGKDARIEKPENVKTEYTEYLKHIISQYTEE